MAPWLIIVLIVVVLILVAALWYATQTSRRKKLQSTFGPEYDRAVADTGNRAEAEKELREREKRHAELELKPLSAESQATYSAAWEEVQIQFVDNPDQALATADSLTTKLIAERGYPTGDYDDRLADLSVEHAQTLQHYRDAHAISLRSADGEASTEDLRQAFVHYRALFADLLGTEPVKTDPTTTPTQTSTDAGEPAAGSDTTAPDTDVAGSRPDATSR
jgi:FtsZ-interacting cell division protein ZipA